MRYCGVLACFVLINHSGAFGAKNDRGAASTVVVDDTFADGDSQNQDLKNNSMWLFNWRATSIRTDKPGSVTPVGTSSEAFWAYFTNAGAPIALGVGDKLSVAIAFPLIGFTNNGNDVRFGVFDSLGTRKTNNLGGGQNDCFR